MDPDFRHKRLLHATIDSWIAPYRAAKAQKREQQAAARLLIAQGVRALTRVEFALEWRWTPLEHWWEAELRTLQDPAQVGPSMIDALMTASPDPLQEVLKRLEPLLEAEGVPPRQEWLDVFMELTRLKLSYSPINCTTTSLRRGLVSKSTSTICCQVPRVRRL
jgi:hypothetical protein